MISVVYFVFFFKQKTAYEMRISDWSSDVCSSDLDKWSGALAGVQVSSVAVGGSAAPNSPSLTATWGKGRTLWFSFIGTADDDAAVTAYPADYEGGVNTLSGASINDGGAVASARRAQEVATENPGAAPLNAVDAWGAVTVALRPR